MNKEAKNMEAIYKAKQHHDNTCPWGGEGKRIYMAQFDIDRMGWEEGDVIAGLVNLSGYHIALRTVYYKARRAIEDAMLNYPHDSYFYRRLC